MATPPPNHLRRYDAELRRIEPGDVLAGKYRVEKVLGEGGMGQVLEAVHVELDQRVAVKALLPQMATQEEAVARFTREAKGLAKLNSEHVARVSDVGKTESGQPFMVMEFLEGKDLGELIDARGALPIEEAVELGLHACAGLAEVHAAGIIHRDMKPSNCYVVTRGDGTPCLKLLDFGISKFRGTAVTRTAAIMGSPGYMSPEQMASTKDVDERADIWALGATLYEMLTARAAFEAENAPMLCIKIANEEPDPPRRARADIPEGLEGVLLKCLAKVPEARYTNVAEVARALAPYGPERARSYVEKIEGILRGARVTPASDRPPAPNLYDRPTVRAGDGDAPKKPTPVPVASLVAVVERETVAPGKLRPVSEDAKPVAVSRPPKGRRRTVLFLGLGMLGGAMLAIAGFAIVRARADVARARTTAAAPSAVVAEVDAVAPLAEVDGGAAAASPVANPANDADAALDDDDEDDEDGGSAVDAAPAAPHRTTPRRRPRPHPVPKRPRHK